MLWAEDHRHLTFTIFTIFMKIIIMIMMMIIIIIIIIIIITSRCGPTCPR